MKLENVIEPRKGYYINNHGEQLTGAECQGKTCEHGGDRVLRVLPEMREC